MLAPTLVRPNPLVQWAQASARVTAMPAGYYLVQFPASIRPQAHVVLKDKSCLCELALDCPAVSAVTRYLRQGGDRAPDRPTQSVIPAACPICGGPVRFEPRLCSPERGAGWVCLTAASQEVSTLPPKLRLPGRSHYWQYLWTGLWQRVQKAQR